MQSEPNITFDDVSDEDCLHDDDNVDLKECGYFKDQDTQVVGKDQILTAIVEVVPDLEGSMQNIPLKKKCAGDGAVSPVFDEIEHSHIDSTISTVADSRASFKG